MNFTYDSTFMPHRSSRRDVNRAALFAEYSRADKLSMRLLSPFTFAYSYILIPDLFILTDTLFNVRTFRHIGQQVLLAYTLDTMSTDVCCILETRMQLLSSQHPDTRDYGLRLVPKLLQRVALVWYNLKFSSRRFVA
ncbi:hypothetical protein CLF_106436 [Clonorchis sinensis]|uniref:Uncharacterized protein n=1 Tax=Clonorchis sinensis TaxID=79923 RepID=G7YF57_CLOSI|nr:hypothetical protein CLF_106436 [Clonorchis sinensis]